MKIYVYFCIVKVIKTYENMKKWMFLSMVFAVFPAAMMAQDDMYFASDKSAKTAKQESSRVSSSTYYSGSSRSVDEYNRRLGSSYAVLPADTGDVISFAPVEGAYPDSVSDFQMTRQMQRWDDYVPSTAYWEGYAQGRRDAWGWHSPWYYSAYYPWYDSWYYDPWYYDSWYYGWHHPWYGGYGWSWGYYGWGYHYPWYGGHHHVYYANRQPGTINRYGSTHGGFTGNRSTNTAARSTSVRNTNGSRTTTTVRNTSSSGNFTGNRSTSSYNSNSGTVSSSRNTSTSNGGFSGGGGSFSGGRSGGGSMGGGGGRSGGSRR